MSKASGGESSPRRLRDVPAVLQVRRSSDVDVVGGNISGTGDDFDFSIGFVAEPDAAELMAILEEAARAFLAQRRERVTYSDFQYARPDDGAEAVSGADR